MSMIKVHNAETGEVIEREMTEEELLQAEKDAADWAASEAQKAAKEKARAEILERLGISSDEASLILG